MPRSSGAVFWFGELDSMNYATAERITRLVRFRRPNSHWSVHNGYARVLRTPVTVQFAKQMLMKFATIHTQHKGGGGGLNLCP